VRQNTFKTTLKYETDRKARTTKSSKKLTVNYVKPAFLASNSDFKA
jgi:hypothetical protein